MGSVIAGNWKLNHTPASTTAYFERLRERAGPDPGPLLIFPPALCLAAARAAAPDWVSFGVQNIFWQETGAFTGELSASLAREAGATHTLVGHSERRHVFGESDQDVTRKTRAALEHGLVPVICVGETLDERRTGRVTAVILRQLSAVLAELAEFPDAGTLIAYEPVWAIGTGETATPEDAAEAHGALRARLTEELGETGSDLPILYGGSVKPENAAELLAAPEVGGVLVGGASLDPESFLGIAAFR